MTENELLKVDKRANNAILTEVGTKSSEVTNTIKNLSLIAPNDLQRLEKAQTFIVSNYIEVPEYRPMIIKLASVLNDGSFPTPDSKYWQCKKEAEVHFNQLVVELYKYERCKVDIEEMDYTVASLEKTIDTQVSTDAIDPIKVKFEIRRMTLKRDEYLFNMKNLEKSIKYRIEEICDWYDISESLKHECKYKDGNYNNHLVENLYKKLKYDVSNAKNDQEKNNFASQLRTLERLIKSNQKQ